MTTLQSLIRYKDIILYRTQAGIKSEARQNYLGYVWFLLEPILSTAVLYLAFSQITGKTGPDQILLILIGMVTWSGIEPAIMSGSNAIKAKFHVLNQFSLPKWIFPVVTILVTLWKSLFVLGVIVAYSLAIGHPPSWALLWLLPIFIVQFILIVGVTLPLSIAVTLVNDLNTVVGSIFRLTFFVSGVFFPVERVPVELQNAFHWNPVAVLIEANRAVIMQGVAPNFALLGRATLIAVALAIFGLLLNAYYDKKILKLTNV